MRMLRGLVAIGVFLGVVGWLTQHYQVHDRLLASFVALGSSLPLWMTLEQFLTLVANQLDHIRVGRSMYLGGLH